MDKNLSKRGKLPAPSSKKRAQLSCLTFEHRKNGLRGQRINPSIAQYCVFNQLTEDSTS